MLCCVVRLEDAVRGGDLVELLCAKLGVARLYTERGTKKYVQKLEQIKQGKIEVISKAVPPP